MDEIRRIHACKDDFYNVLRLRKNATDKEIKEAYRRLAKLVHPDKNNGGLAATEAFKILGNAYKTLIEPVKRRRYDINKHKNQNRRRNDKSQTNEQNSNNPKQKRKRKARRYRKKQKNQKTQEESDHQPFNEKSGGFFSEKGQCGHRSKEKENDQWNHSFDKVFFWEPDSYDQFEEGAFDDFGEPFFDESGTVIDEFGEPVFDEFGESIFQEFGQPVFQEFGQPWSYDANNGEGDGFFTTLFALIKFVLKWASIIGIVLWVTQWKWETEDSTFHYFEDLPKEVFFSGNKPFWTLSTTLATDFLTGFFMKFRDRFMHSKIFRLFRFFRI